MTERTLKGSCLCGAVRYTVTGEPQRFYHCHCSRCRKATGTGHATNLFVKGRLTWDSGEELIRRYKPPQAERFTNAFCTSCGARVPRFIEQQGGHRSAGTDLPGFTRRLVLRRLDAARVRRIRGLRRGANASRRASWRRRSRAAAFGLRRLAANDP